jgi:hypothetical protein
MHTHAYTYMYVCMYTYIYFLFGMWSGWMDGGDAFFQIMIMHDGWQMRRSK